METNLYLDIVKKSPSKKIQLKKHQNKVIPREIQIKYSPKREIIQKQKNKCFLCGNHFGNSITQFTVIEGPDPETKQITRETRALCQECYLKQKNL